MKLQNMINKFKFQTIYGQALTVTVNGGFIKLDDAKTGVAFDWMMAEEFVEVISGAIDEGNNTLTINW